MKKIYFLINLFFIYLLCIFPLLGEESKYFNDGKKLFLKDDFEGSKFLFEKDIVQNPKSEMSYLYLAKIFENEENEEYEELNLNTVLLLNPKNEEAIYKLILLKIKQSDFANAKELLEKFNLVCASICNKNEEIRKKLKNLSP